MAGDSSTREMSKRQRYLSSLEQKSWQNEVVPWEPTSLVAAGAAADLRRHQNCEARFPEELPARRVSSRKSWALSWRQLAACGQFP